MSVLLELVFFFFFLILFSFLNLGNLFNYFDFVFAEDTIENRTDKVPAFMVLIFLSEKTDKKITKQLNNTISKG